MRVYGLQLYQDTWKDVGGTELHFGDKMDLMCGMVKIICLFSI